MDKSNSRSPSSSDSPWGKNGNSSKKIKKTAFLREHKIQFCGVKNERKSSFLRPEMTFSDRFLVAPVKIRNTWFYPSVSRKDNFLTLPVDVLWKYVASAWKTLKTPQKWSKTYPSVIKCCRLPVFVGVLGVEFELEVKVTVTVVARRREKNTKKIQKRVRRFYGHWDFSKPKPLYRPAGLNSNGQVTIYTFGRDRVAIPCNR